MFRKLAALLALSLALSGCAALGPKPWTTGSGPIKIVASTNVWGSVAAAVAGKNATVDALIYNSSQDPHSFEASARDQLLINNADIVIMNGGGYDDFVEQLVEADDSPAILVTAYMAAGEDDGRNEHIWYDVDQVGDVAAVIGGAIEAVDSKLADQTWAAVDAFRAELAKRKLLLDAMKAQKICGNVFATEPLVDYLLEDAGCKNVTPVEFSDAIEEERDVPPATIAKAKSILAGNLDFLAINESSSSAQIEELIGTAPKTLRVRSFTELLGDGDYLALLDSTIEKVAGK